MKTKKNFLKKLAAVTLGFVMTLGVGAAGYAGAASEAKGETTYSRLESIASIDESASYVLGIDGIGFHYSGTSSWGKTALPSAQTPLYYTLTKATDGLSFSASTSINGSTYYLTVPTSNNFTMSTSSSDLIIGTTQYNAGDDKGYAVANKTTTTRHLRRNGDSGLRSYAGNTGALAFFYKVNSGGEVTKFTVEYNGNGNTGGSVPVDSNEYEKNSSVTIKANVNSLQKTGFEFAGWNTQADGKGTDYAASGIATFNITGNTVLYAKWRVPGSVDDTYSKLNNLVANENVLIVSCNGTSYYVLGATNGTDAAPDAIEVSVSNNKLKTKSGQTTILSEHLWTVSGSSSGWTFTSVANPNACLYCTNTNNGVRVGAGDANVFTINSGYLYETGTKDARYLGVYDESDWRCYTSINSNIEGQTFSFWTKDAPAQVYTATKNGTNVSFTNESACQSDQDYSVEISPNPGYNGVSIDSVVKTGTTDSVTYTFSNNVLTIAKENLPGDITITAEATRSELGISLSSSSSNVSLNSSTKPVYYESYSNKLIADTGYDLPTSISMTMGGNSFSNFTYISDKTSANYGQFSINAELITGDLVITAVTAEHQYSLTSSLTNITCSEDGSSSRYYNHKFIATLSAATSYTLTGATITVKMGGQTVSGAYNSSTHVITIDKVTGNIEISGEAIYVSTPIIQLNPANGISFEYGVPASITVSASNVKSVDSISVSKTSDGDSVASFNTSNVSSIALSALKAGTATYSITVYYTDNGDQGGSTTFTDYSVTVTRHTSVTYNVDSSTVTKDSTVTSYVYGETYELNLTAKQNFFFDDGDISVVADSTDITEDVTMIDADEAYICITDAYDSITITAEATAVPEEIISIDFASDTAQNTEFILGEEFTCSGLKVVGNTNYGHTREVTDYTVDSSDVDMFTEGEYTVYVEYEEIDIIEYSITVSAKSVTSSWTKATSIDTTKEYVMVCDSLNYELTGISTTTTKYGLYTEYQETNLSGSLKFSFVAVDATNNKYKLKSGDNYFKCSEPTTKANDLYLDSTGTEFTVTFDENNNINLDYIGYDSGNVDKRVAFNHQANQYRFAGYKVDTLNNSTNGYAADKYRRIQVYEETPSDNYDLIKVTANHNIPSTTELYEGDTVELKDFDVYALFNDGEEATKLESGYKINGGTEVTLVKAPAGDAKNQITVSYTDPNNSENIKTCYVYMPEVKEDTRQITSVKLVVGSTAKTTYYYDRGDTSWVYTDMQVVVYFNDDSTIPMNLSSLIGNGASVSPSAPSNPTGLQTDKQTFTVTYSYEGHAIDITTSTVEVTVTNDYISKLSWTGHQSATDKKTYTAGSILSEVIDTSAWEFKATWASGAPQTTLELGTGENKVHLGIYYKDNNNEFIAVSGKSNIGIDYEFSPEDNGKYLGASYNGQLFSFNSRDMLTIIDFSSVSLDFGMSYKFTKDNIPTSSSDNVANKAETRAATSTGTEYIKVTSSSDIEAGKKYLIVYGSCALDGRLTSDVASNYVSVSVSSNKISGNSDIDAAAVTIGSDGSILGQTKYIGHTGTSNSLNYSNTALANTLSIDSDGNVVIQSGDYVMRYNDGSGQTRFRYYKSGQKAIQLYKLVETKKLSRIAIEGTPQTSYYVGDLYTSTGLKVVAYYTDGTSKDLTSTEAPITISKTNAEVGDTSITFSASYTEDSVPKNIDRIVDVSVTRYKDVAFKLTIKTSGMDQLIAEYGENFEDIGICITYSGKTRYFSYIPAQGDKYYMYEGDTETAYKLTNGSFGLNLGDAINDQTRAAIVFSVKIYMKDSSGNYYYSDITTVSLLSWLEDHNTEQYQTDKFLEIYQIFYPSAN